MNGRGAVTPSQSSQCEWRRHGSFLTSERLVVTPALVREGVHLLDLADDAAADERFAVALRPRRGDLDAHLRGEAALRAPAR